MMAAGYIYIGLDHFALPDDELARALHQGRLHRDFMGYSSRIDSDLIGLGVSAIGRVGPHYHQNHRDLDSYCDAIANARLPIARGLSLSADDLLRRAVIQSLLCRFELEFEPFETAYLIDFAQYFSAEWPHLLELQEDGLIHLDTRGLRITARGRPLARIVAMAFDRYLREAQTSARYSRVI
jgi:oxygen-independent coproporphyrinogen-3 oxidase